jgi:mannosyltransferase OCH1-like enzyme
MSVEKRISPRTKNIPLENKFNISYENEIYDLHVAFYYINIHQFRVIIRRLDDAGGWNNKFHIKIFDANNQDYETILVKASETNTAEFTYILKINLKPVNMNYEQKIPKTIIQTSKSSTGLETLHYNSIMTFIDLNPEYEYQFYDDTMCKTFIEQNYDPSILEAYNALIPTAFKADLFRYCYLYKNGGVYTDCKMILRKPLREWIFNNQEYLLVEDYGSKQFYNAVMAMTPGNTQIYQLILKIRDNTVNYAYGFSCLEYTGPKLLYKYFNNYNSQFKHIVINGDAENNYLNTMVIRKSDKKIILNKFYKGYYSTNKANHYSVQCANNTIYYKNIVNTNGFTVMVYPDTEIDSTNMKFDFIISGTKLVIKRIDKNLGWSNSLRVKLLDNKNKTEKILEVGSSSSNIKEFYIY